MQHLVHSTFFNADILFGLLFLLMAVFTKLFPPRTSRNIYGYRSFLSTRNPDTWKEANRFASNHSFRIAFVLIGIGVTLGLLFKTQNNWYYLFSIGTVIIAALNLRGETEWYLSQHFEDDGERKVKPERRKPANELSPDNPPESET